MSHVGGPISSVPIFLQPYEMELASVKVPRVVAMSDVCTIVLLLQNCVPTRAPLISHLDDSSQAVMRIDWDDNSALEYVSLNASRFQRGSDKPRGSQRVAHNYVTSYIAGAGKQISPRVHCLWLPGLPTLEVNAEFDVAAQCQKYDSRTARYGYEYPKATFSAVTVYWLSTTVGFATWMSPVNPEKVATILSSVGDDKVAFVSAKNGQIHPRIVAVYIKEQYFDSAFGHRSDNISDHVTFIMKDNTTRVTAAIVSQFPVSTRPDASLATLVNFNSTSEQPWLPSRQAAAATTKTSGNKQTRKYISYAELAPRVVSIITILLGRSSRDDSETSFLTIISATSWANKYYTFKVNISTIDAVTQEMQIVGYETLATNIVENKTATVIWSTKLLPDRRVDVDYTINFQVASQSGATIISNSSSSGPLRLPSDLETNWYQVYSLDVKQTTFASLIYPRTEDMASFIISPASCLSHTIGVSVNNIMLDPQYYSDTDIDLLSVICEPPTIGGNSAAGGGGGGVGVVKEWCQAENATVTVKVSCL